MSHIILADMGDTHLLSHIFLALNPDGVSCLRIQKLCCLLADDCTVVIQRISFLGFPVMKIHIRIHIVQIAQYRNIGLSLFLSLGQHNALHISIHVPFNILIFCKEFIQLCPVFFLQIFLQENLPVIKLNPVILGIRYLIYRIPNPVPYNHQRHTAADSKYGHKEPFLIPHQIPHGRLPGKIQAFPDKRRSL